MFQLQGTINRSSSAARWIDVNVINGTCTVRYNNGDIYNYYNVSRRALFSVLNNENVSLGFFINNALTAVNSKCGNNCAMWTTSALA